jgi:hypothetical protein
MIRKWLTGPMAGMALSCASSAIATAGEASRLILAQGVTVQKAGTRNWVVEALVVVVLFGAALFVICKSSRRV